MKRLVRPLCWVIKVKHKASNLHRKTITKLTLRLFEFFPLLNRFNQNFELIRSTSLLKFSLSDSFVRIVLYF